MYKKFYQYFLQKNPNVQHYASHSHHYWPDVTKQATIDYWNDSASLVDDKWNYIFSKKVPLVQDLIAEVLNLSNPKQIVFAPNTHEFIYRILSCFEPTKKINILTTDSEFYSFQRQINRLSETGLLNIDIVKIDSAENFEKKLAEKIKNNEYDLIFISQVFFNSGLVIQDIKALVDLVKKPETIFVVDGYHGFMAIPTDLKLIEDRIFYISGSYKYAQGGEGCCFMHVPKGCQLRPIYTGWFAGFENLTNSGSVVTYSYDGYRFAGSTMDYTALYRLASVLELFKKEGLTVKGIHEHVVGLQKYFLEELKKQTAFELNENQIIKNGQAVHGHFLTFNLENDLKAEEIHAKLKSKNIITDYRGNRLRFGFGLYQDERINFNGKV